MNSAPLLTVISVEAFGVLVLLREPAEAEPSPEELLDWRLLAACALIQLSARGRTVRASVADLRAGQGMQAFSDCDPTSKSDSQRQANESERC